MIGMTKRKIGKLVVKDLMERSKEGLDLAKHLMLAEKIEHPILQEALEYYVDNWNEYTHPGLFLMAFEAAGGKKEEGLQAQAAVAMFTAAFDLHDDVIDKSKEKHKIPTVYGKFGYEIALLVGDAFLIEGFKLFADSIITTLPKERQKKALDGLQKLLFEVGNAHVSEISSRENKDISTDEYMKTIERKAATLEADMYLGALFGGAKDVDAAFLARIGRILGILITLREDIIDVFDIEELRQRIMVQDLPLPLILAMKDQKIKERADAIISKPRLTKYDVAELVDLTIESPPVAVLKNAMQQLIAEGLNLSSKLPETKLTNKLCDLLKFMLEDL
jgi:geranylgeranyl diphosphate synthase type II